MPEFLIIGSGQLGTKLMERLEDRSAITYNTKRVVGAVKLDITSRESVLGILKTLKPEIIFHTAALTKVDLCESDKKLAYTINVGGTKNIIDAAKKTGAKLVYISTDFVFDGEKGNYKETDKTNPVNYYGKTKTLAEELLKKSGLDYIIARTSFLYSSYAKTFNFVRWVVEELRKKNTIKTATDYITSPTLADNMADALIDISRDREGIYHIAGSEKISAYNFSMKVAQEFDLDASLIQPIKLMDLKFLGKRPSNTWLNISKISHNTKVKMLDVKQGLRYVHDL